MTGYGEARANGSGLSVNIEVRTVNNRHLKLVVRGSDPYPMLEADIDRMLHDQLGHAQHEPNFGQYLASLGKTPEQIREELRPIAADRLRRSLVLSKVTDAEHIDVVDGEVSDEIEKLTSSAGPQGAQLRTMFDTEEGRATIRRNLLTRKALDRLVEIATQDGGAAATAEQEQPARKSKKASKKKESPAKGAALAVEQSE